MSQQIINTGANANDGTGEPLREAFTAVNENFTEIYTAGPVGTNVKITGNTITTIVTNQNLVLQANGIGNIQANSTIVPGTAGVYDIGSTDSPFAYVHSQYFVGNGALLTGISVSGGTKIQDGNSYANVTTTSGNVTIGANGDVWTFDTAGNLTLPTNTSSINYANGTPYGGTSGTPYSNSNVASFLAVYGSNTISATGNITGGYIFGNGSQLTGLPATYGNANVVANLAALGSNPISTTGNITGGYILGNGSQLIGVTASNIGVLTTLSVTGSITGGNVLTGGLISATGTITGSSHLGSVVSVTANVTGGNVLTGGLISATGNITGNYIFGNGSQLTGLPATYGNANVVANLAALGSNPISTTGNITSSYFIGNGSALTGITVAAGSQIINGTSNVTVANGANITLGVAGTTIVTVASTGEYVLGVVSVSGNVTGGNVLTAGLISSTGTITGSSLLGSVVSVSANVTGGNVLTGGLVSATSNVTGGNVLTGGLVSATGNVTGGNILTGGLISVTSTITSAANITGGNVLTAGLISATGNGIFGNMSISGPGGNITGANVISSTSLSSTANITGGNVLTGGVISATGTITSAANIIGGNVLTGGLVSATGTVTGSSILGSVVSASANITGGNVLTAGLISATSTITSAANITGGNVLTSGLISATGNVTGGNVNTGTVRNSNGALTISTGSAGNINLNPAGNIVLANTYINSVAYPIQDQDAASKIYVDNFATTGISYHQPVTAATTTTLAITTGGTITYTQPNGVANGVGALLTTTGSFNLIDTANVQTANTRILVKNEANAVVNGVYTWANATNIVRSTDTDEYGSNSTEQLSINDYFFVQSGNVNAGSAYLVSAPAGTITFGTSNITFSQFSSSQTYTANTNAGISLAGTVINAKVDNTTTAFDGTGNISVKTGAVLTTPNIGAATGTSLSTTGNVTGGNVLTSGVISATGTITSAANITGGNVLTAGLISSTGTITGSSHLGSVVSASANITGGNVLTGGLISSAGTVTGSSILGSVVSVSANITGGNVLTGGLISSTSTITSAANITGGNLLTAGLISSTGTVTGSSLLGSVVSASANITGGNVLTAGLISSTGTITGSSHLGSVVSASANITGGNVLTGGLISSTGTVTGSSLLGSVVSASANITGGNVLTGGVISATGNISGSYFIGNGSALTGITVAAGSQIINGTSNVTVAANSNVTIGVAGSTVGTFASTGEYVTGVVSATGNITGNYFIGNGSLLTGITSGGVSTGNLLPMGTPTDGNLTGNTVAYQGWTTSTYVTDGLDDLNQVALNIAGNTFVGNTYITANVSAGPSPLSVLLTGRYIGNPNSYLWQFGDGTANVATANATHTFSNTLGGTYTVSYTAYNTNGTYGGNAANGAKGSTSTATTTITLYTPTPIPSFTANRTSLDTPGGVLITNTSQYAETYSINWGDGTIVIPANSWTTASHTYTNASANTDVLYGLNLTGNSANAGASPVSVTSSNTNVKVYSSQSGNVFVTANVANVINGVGTISFRNDSNGTPGNTASFGAQQLYSFNYGDGTISNVNVQSGLAGNPGAANVTRLFALSAANQSGNKYEQFTANLSLYTGYSTSPFKSGNITITVEPQTRANYIGTTANVTTDATANTGNVRVGYLYTDYNGANRSTFTFQNTSENSNIANWTWGDATFSNGVSNVSNVLHTYNSTGAFTVSLQANGTPNGITSTAQSNTFSTTGYIFIAANPTAPTALSGFANLTIANASQGTSPLLAAGATDASGGNIPANGTSVTRFATTTTIVTSPNVINANTATTGTLFAYVNNANAGSVTFSTGGNAATASPYGALVVSADRDLHIANAAVPSYFYKVFSANVSCALSSLSTGYNNYKMVHSVSGNTNYVGFVKDNLNSAPTLVTGNVAMAEGTAGTYRYISGIPYYNTGSPTITIANLQVANLAGQTYTSTNPFILDTGTVYEGSGGLVSATQTKSLAGIDNTGNSMLTGSNVKANIGVTANYTFGNLTANLTGANNTVSTLQANILNVIGTSTTSQLPTKIQMYAGANSGVNEQSITCTPTANTQAAIRIVMSTTGNTPVFSNSTNFYTANAWSGAQTIAGTPEAVVRYGVLTQYAVDLSTGYLPVGPNLSVTGSRTSTQYFTFAFARPSLANFDIRLTTTTGVAGVWLAAPGTTIDTGGFSSPTPGFPGPTSSINGWLEGFTQYAGSGVPGAATATGGNGSNGCALTGADVIPLNTAIANVGYTMTLGSQNAANSTGTNILIRIALASGQSITALSIGVAA